MVVDGFAGNYASFDEGWFDLENLEFYGAVLDENTVFFFYFLMEFGILNRNSVGSGFFLGFRIEQNGLARFDGNTFGFYFASADSRALEILENGNGGFEFFRDFSDVFDHFGKLGVGAMGKIEASYSHAG